MNATGTGERIGAALAYFLAVALFVLLQELGLRLRKAEQRAWWAGNGRDLLNVVGLATVTGALRGYGFPLPAAFAVAATVTLALFGTSIYMEARARVSHPRAWALALGLALGAPVLLFSGEILRAFELLSARLFPFVQ